MMVTVLPSYAVTWPSIQSEFDPVYVARTRAPATVEKAAVETTKFCAVPVTMSAEDKLVAASTERGAKGGAVTITLVG